MRNEYPGKCYVCLEEVEKGKGHIERNGKGGWQVRHVNCESKHYLKNESVKANPKCVL